MKMQDRIYWSTMHIVRVTFSGTFVSVSYTNTHTKTYRHIFVYCGLCQNAGKSMS